MRTMLLMSVFAAAAVRADESSAVSMRRKLHAQIVASLPTPRPAAEALDIPALDTLDDELVEIEPLIVVDSPVLRQLAAKIERDRQTIKDAQFSPVKGGTIYKNTRFEIGTWADPAGLTLFKMRF
jgi:hypothetical protein